MLLVVDIGNTNIVMGVFKGKRLFKDWRIGTNRTGSSDEYGSTILNLFTCAKVDPEEIKGAAISCVVPSLQTIFSDAVRKYLEIEPLTVGPGIKTGMPILYDNPKDVGADRVVNAVSAFEKFKRDLIIIDFGTATTFDYISKKGEYVGGAIAPGIMVSLEALSQRASKLPRVGFMKPERVIGKNTVFSMQSGSFYGYVSLVEGMVDRVKKEVGGKPMVIATGGLAPLIASGTPKIDEVEQNLTLEGLRIIFDRNQTA